MKRSSYVLVGFYFLFIGCRPNNKDSSIHPAFEFNLFSKKDLINVYNYIDCNNENTDDDEIFFLQIRSKNQDTIFVNTYKNGKSIFLISPRSIIRKHEGDYLIEGVEPFYPSSSIDTILPFQNKIYPFFMILPQETENILVLVEPSVFIKNMKPMKINFPKKLKSIKYPFIIFRVENGNIIDFTTEFTNLFKKY